MTGIWVSDRTCAPETGVIMPIGCVNARDMADHDAGARSRFARRRFAGSVGFVVAAFPQMAETRCLHRYPSPDRRLCALLRRPPLFFCESDAYLNRQSPACSVGPRHSGFDAKASLALTARYRDEVTKGHSSCNSNLASLSQRPWPHFQVVGIPCQSRRLSAPVQVRERRRSSMDRSQRARLWVRPVTWPIASPTRADVNPLKNSGATRRSRQPSLQAIGVQQGTPVAFLRDAPAEPHRVSRKDKKGT